MNKTLPALSTFKEQRSWAIRTRYKDRYFFVGRYWRFPNEGRPQDTVLETRLFATRTLARAALKSMKAEAGASFPDASVKRVRIRIEEIP